MGVEDSIVCSVNIVSGIESAQVGLHLHMPCHDRVLFNCSLVSIFDKDGGNARLDIQFSCYRKKKTRHPILPCQAQQFGLCWVTALTAEATA